MTIERLALYLTMYRIRCCEETLDRLFAAGALKGTTHLSCGQESIAAGVCAALTNDDLVLSSHRGHGHFLAKGGDVHALFAEFFGSAAGVCGGRGGSQHLFAPDCGFLYAGGITGGGLPLALGAAFSAAYRKAETIAVAFIGDGACNQGMFHETLNMAAVWHLPLLVVIENNGYAMYTDSRLTTAGEGPLARRALAYGIRGVTIPHDPVEEIARTARELRRQMLAESVPAVLEIMTYRLCGHSKSDDCSYRSAEEMAARQVQDPLHLARQRLLADGIIAAGELAAREAELADEVSAAAAAAEAAPMPEN